MKAKPVAALLSTLALAATLVACGAPSSFSQETLSEASGIKVEVENADAQSGANTAGAITVEEGGVIAISPFLDKGAIHVTITSSDGKTTVYDDDASGKVMFTVPAEPGTYDVATSASAGTTGSMTVFAANQNALDEQDAALADLLEQEGIELEGVTSE